MARSTVNITYWGKGNTRLLNISFGLIWLRTRNLCKCDICLAFFSWEAGDVHFRHLFMFLVTHWCYVTWPCSCPIKTVFFHTCFRHRLMQKCSHIIKVITQHWVPLKRELLRFDNLDLIIYIAILVLFQWILQPNLVISMLHLVELIH